VITIRGKQQKEESTQDFFHDRQMKMHIEAEEVKKKPFAIVEPLAQSLAQSIRNRLSDVDTTRAENTLVNLAAIAFPDIMRGDAFYYEGIPALVAQLNSQYLCLRGRDSFQEKLTERMKELYPALQEQSYCSLMDVDLDKRRSLMNEFWWPHKSKAALEALFSFADYVCTSMRQYMSVPYGNLQAALRSERNLGGGRKPSDEVPRIAARMDRIEELIRSTPEQLQRTYQQFNVGNSALHTLTRSSLVATGAQKESLYDIIERQYHATTYLRPAETLQCASRTVSQDVVKNQKPHHYRKTHYQKDSQKIAA